MKNVNYTRTYSILKKSIIGLLLLLPVTLYAQHGSLTKQLEQAIKGKKAEIGIAVVIDGKDTIAINNDTRYPMMSVFKFHQALALADYMNRRNIPLDTQLNITKEDLNPNTYSPLQKKYPEGGIRMSIADLLKYTLQQSDNNACDILFRYQGGPKAADEYIRSLGISSCSIAITENEMGEDLNRCYLNWTTPLSAVRLLEIFLHQPLFADTYKDFTYQTMAECETGKNRLPAPLPDKDVTIGHKTGTGPRNSKGQQIGCNDIGFVRLPNGRSYTIAVFVKDSEGDDEANSRTIAEISRIVYEYIL